MEMPREPRATIDFESRSSISLRKQGTWRYSIDPTTHILCLAFRLPTWESGRVSLWHPSFPSLGMPEPSVFDDILELIEWIQDGGLVEAHNAWFEYCLWKNVLSARYAWPRVPDKQWRCSAAKAAAHALPRALEKVAAILQVGVQKDMDGTKTMKKMTKPRKSRKAERELWMSQGEEEPDILYHETPELLERLFIYCKIDVLAEEEVSEALPDLSPAETGLYLLDQKINARGFQLDQEAVASALQLITDESVILNHQLAEVTHGTVQKATQRAQVRAWLHEQGVDLPDTQRATVEGVLGNPRLPYAARQGLEILRDLGRSSTAKYVTMNGWQDPTGLIRGGLLYHGASTGRWTGAGVQPQNFPRGTVKDQERLWDILKTRDRHLIAHEYTSVMEALSNALRGTIVARRNHQLFVADYASIEARVLFWLAGDDGALDLFRRHEDIYCDMASSIYKRPITKMDVTERQMGKQAILGLGYQMGWSKFQATCKGYKIPVTEELAHTVVDAYRKKYWRVKQLWYDQEQAAVQAWCDSNELQCGRMWWMPTERFLYCQLPSGRRLAYPFPEVKKDMTPWGEPKWGLTFKGINPVTRQWQRQKTYGGSLVENQTQAVARDLMADAMRRCDAHPTYDLVLSVHDELIAEAPLGQGNVKEFETLMATCPDWAQGCPVEAEGWTGLRYRK